MSENRRRRNNGAQNRQVKKARTNNARRILLLVGLMSLVAVISIGGTIAWLTDKTDPVTNTFTASDVHITLSESNTVNNAKSFKMVPGATINKDPKITVDSDSEDCWVFVKVEESDNLRTFIDYEIAAGWKQLMQPVEGSDPKPVQGVYYRKVLNSDTTREFSVIGYTNADEEFVNDYVYVNDTVTKTMMDGLTPETQPTLKFTAYAIQVASFENEDNIYDAWTEINK